MGCSPLGQMVSTVFGKCGGGERRRASKMMIVSPPPSYLYSRPRTVVKSVSFSNDNPIIIIPPNQNQQPAEMPPMPPVHQSTGPPHVVAEGAEPARVRFAGGARPKDARPPPSGPVHPEPVTAQRGAPHGYVMSPLPRWEERPRRREYFSGEYHYYPTPIREGIYEIATDANRLTTIFSEENPNACVIA